jgi:glycosyltransferase involved in cell wall biosynthesis
VPRVSVIIPTYNRADMVGDAIQSVLDQTYSDWELIVVDDGSTDNTGDVVARYEDERIRHIHQANRKLPGARNTGIRAAHGELIAFLDSDDLFLPRKLAQQVAFLDAHPEVGLVAGGHVEVDRQLRLLREVAPWHSQTGLGLADWLYSCPFVPSAVLVQRAWPEKVGLFDETMRYVEDWDLWLRLAAAGCQMAWLHDLVCAYRFHGSNMVRDVRPMQAGILKVLDKFYERQDLHEDVLRLHDRAYAHAYLGAAARAYAASAVEDGRAWLGTALALDSSLLAGNPPRFLDILASFAQTPLVENGLVFIRTVVRNLPDTPLILAWSPRRATGLYRAVAAFDAYQRGEYRKVPMRVAAALVTDPRWLRNRGLLAITSRALIRLARHSGPEATCG